MVDNSKYLNFYDHKTNPYGKKVRYLLWDWGLGKGGRKLNLRG